MPRNRFWQSGGTKWGMWKTPFLTFSNKFLKLSSSNGRAPFKTNRNAFRKQFVWANMVKSMNQNQARILQVENIKKKKLRDKKHISYDSGSTDLEPYSPLLSNCKHLI